jgi:hypothetical protein
VLSWYMKLVQGLAQPEPLNEINNVLIAEFKKPKLESQCITGDQAKGSRTCLGVRIEIQDSNRSIDFYDPR